MPKSLLRAVLCLLVAAVAAQAIDYVSNNDGDWGTTTIWTPNGLPGAADNVTINHNVTVDAARACLNITIGGAGTLICAAANTLTVNGNWANNGATSLTAGTVVFGGTLPASIGGSNQTTFYQASVSKNALTTTVTMNQSVTVSAGGTAALRIATGTLSTNGRDLTVNGAGASVGGDGMSNGKLDINTGGTVNIRNLYQGELADALGRVAISGGTVNINGQHQMARYETYYRYCDISGGTVNYNASGTTVGLYMTPQLPLGTTNYWIATGGTINFYGSVTCTWTGLTVSGDAHVYFRGGANSTFSLNTYMGGPNALTHSYSNITIAKESGFGVNITGGASGYFTNSFFCTNLTVNSGATLTLIYSGFRAPAGYNLKNVVNNGDIIHTSQGNPSYNGDIIGNESWTGTGTYTQTSNIPHPNVTATGNVTSGSMTTTGTISIAGDLACAVAYSGTGELVFTGSGANTVSAGSSLAAYRLTVGKPGGSLTAGSDLTVTGTLSVSGGTFVLGENDLTLGTTGAAGNVTVAGGATFSAVGSARDADARITAASADYPFGFVVQSAATIAARYATFERTNAAGIVVNGEIDEDDNFSYCAFGRGGVVGPMLAINNSQVLDDIVEVSFSGSVPYYNISKTVDDGHVTITGGGGNCWGYASEFDPYGRIDWAPLPEAPELVRPANNSVSQPLDGRLEWTAAQHATGYDVYLDFNYPPVIKVSENQPELIYEYAGLLKEMPYYWKVVAKNGAGNASSEVWKFTTAGDEPAAFDLYSPANEANEQPVSGILIWYPSVGAAEYEVYFGANDPPPLAGTATGPFFPYGPLNQDQVYYWTVVAKNDFGQTPTSSGTWHFTTITGRPPTAWKEGKSLPGLPTNKPVKDGGWLAVGPDKEAGLGIQESGFGHLATSSVIYAGKGNKTTDFFKYIPEGDSWIALTQVPEMEDGKKKPPSKGTRGISDGTGAVYMTRGNNMLGFWKYDIVRDTWAREEDVPLGNYKKKVKGGEDMVYVVHGDTGYIYLLKGQRTEFYRYNTQSEKWEARQEVPYQNKQKYDKGSFLTYDGEKTIYAHQAKVNNGQNHYMFTFNLETQTWNPTPKKGIPVYGRESGKLKKKKTGDGSAGAWVNDGKAGTVYALKGANTQGFFRYHPAQDTWTEAENLPELGSTNRKKRVKAGGDLVALGGKLFAFKGNKTNEFWWYVEPTTPMMATKPGRDGVMAGVIGNGEWRMGIGPNPLSSGFATLRYSLPRPGPATVTVFDVAGRSVFSTRSPGHLTTGSLPLDLRSLSAGVYLVRLDADNFTQTQKLVVQK